jgi:hypothetical protein
MRRYIDRPSMYCPRVLVVFGEARIDGRGLGARRVGDVADPLEANGRSAPLHLWRP